MLSPRTVRIHLTTSGIPVRSVCWWKPWADYLHGAKVVLEDRTDRPRAVDILQRLDAAVGIESIEQPPTAPDVLFVEFSHIR
jgi:hypothetical protein